ncbi:Hsp20 family protein [bacterium]|nr:Hsp20 family protein [bacterium]
MARFAGTSFANRWALLAGAIPRLQGASPGTAPGRAGERRGALRRRSHGEGIGAVARVGGRDDSCLHRRASSAHWVAHRRRASVGHRCDPTGRRFVADSARCRGERRGARSHPRVAGRAGLSRGGRLLRRRVTTKPSCRLPGSLILGGSRNTPEFQREVATMTIHKKSIAVVVGLAMATIISIGVRAGEQSPATSPEEAARTLQKAEEILRSAELRRDPEVRKAMEELRTALRDADAASVIYNDPNGNASAGASAGSDPFDSFFRNDPFFSNAWDPISGISQMRALQNRMLQNMGPGAGFSFGVVGGSGPSVTMSETPDSYIIKASVPGVEKGKLEVQINSDSVTLSGQQRRTTENRDPSGNVSRSESVSSFSNAVSLPSDADVAKAVTKREGDDVTITIPRINQGAGSGSGRLQATVIEK